MGEKWFAGRRFVLGFGGCFGEVGSVVALGSWWAVVEALGNARLVLRKQLSHADHTEMETGMSGT